MTEEYVLPRRVLLTADPLGGVWSYALELAQGLQEWGVSTVLATLGGTLRPAQRAAAVAIEDLVLAESTHRLEWMPGSSQDFDRAADWLLDLEARHMPDLVHVTGFAQAALAWRAPVLALAHSCLRSWWQAVRGADVPTDCKAYVDGVARGLAAADMVVAPTEAFLGAIERLYGPLPHGRVIPNGRTRALFTARTKERMFFTAGRLWDEAKNVAALSAVAPEVPWPVFTAGERVRPDGTIVPAPADLHYLGVLDAREMASWLGRAAVFVLPARYEPFGLATLEAALSGCALVLGDLPSLRELWDGAAVFVPPEDHAALARALQALAADPARATRLGRVARYRARRFDAETMVEDYIAAYSELIHPNVRGLPTPAGVRGRGPG